MWKLWDHGSLNVAFPFSQKEGALEEYVTLIFLNVSTTTFFMCFIIICLFWIPKIYCLG
jgi:hypothetical protein